MRGCLILLLGVAACAYERAPFDPGDAAAIDGVAIDGAAIDPADARPIDAPADAAVATDASPPTAVMAIAAGARHTCAVLDNGAVRCWGSGAAGKLGHGDVSDVGDDELPSVAGDVAVGGAVTQITAGSEHTCARLATGAVRCWGQGGQGRLGHASIDDLGDDELPASAGDVPIGGLAVAVAAGGRHTCALLTAGAVTCWGAGSAGQLGYSNTFDVGDNEPPSIAGTVMLGDVARQVVTGDLHTCALLIDGDVRCWGTGSRGRLGYGSQNDVGDDETPASAGTVLVGGTVVQLAAGAEHTCALLDTGAVRCWGYNAVGQLGYGNTANVGDDETPASAGDVPLGGTATEIAAAGNHTCARLTAGTVRCWGHGANGRLGYSNLSNVGDNEVPSAAGNVMVGGTVRSIVAGAAHTCAVLTDGTVRCWGQGNEGRLGYGNTSDLGDNETPAMAGTVSVF